MIGLIGSGVSAFKDGGVTRGRGGAAVHGCWRILNVMKALWGGYLFIEFGGIEVVIDGVYEVITMMLMFQCFGIFFFNF